MRPPVNDSGNSTGYFAVYPKETKQWVAALKFYGWGEESTGLDEAERERLFGFLANRLGVAPRLIAAPRVSDISLRPPRLAPPGTMAHLFTSDPYERLLHTYGKSLSGDGSSL